MGARNGFPGQSMIDDEPDRCLALEVRPLMDRRNDRSLFKIRDHFFEEVGCDQLNAPIEPKSVQRPADWQAQNRAHIDPCQILDPEQEITTLEKCFVFVLVAFQNLRDLPSRAHLREELGKPLDFPAMINGFQHAGDNGHLGVWVNKPSHQLTRQSAIELRLNANNGRAVAGGRVGGHTENANVSFLDLIDQRAESLVVPWGDDQGLNIIPEKRLNLFGFALAKAFCGAVKEPDTQMFVTGGFGNEAKANLIVKLAAFPGQAYADA